MIEIIPAIDIIEGRCVRLTKGDYSSQKVYSDSPADVAKRFEDAGCKAIHVVDLDGAKSKHIVNYRALEAIATRTNLIIDFGGGIKSDDDLHIAFNSGAQKVTGGSIAVTHKDVFLGWLEKYGSEKIILGADSSNGKISTNGWLENSDNDLIPFISSYHKAGITQVISTDISKDGMLQGPSTSLYIEILKEMPQLRLIASGGVASMENIYQLQEACVPAVIVGKAFYEGRITMPELERFNLNSEKQC